MKVTWAQITDNNGAWWEAKGEKNGLQVRIVVFPNDVVGIKIDPPNAESLTLTEVWFKKDMGRVFIPCFPLSDMGLNLIGQLTKHVAELEEVAALVLDGERLVHTP